MSDQFTMFDLMNCEALPNAISSPEAGCGASPPALPDGLTTARSGPARARASRSASQEKAQAPVIHGTCGPTSFASSVPAGPLSSWESRLRDRLAMVGSTEFPLIWKEKVTPAGRSISRLAPSMRRTSDSGSIGSQWATPTARDHFPAHTPEYIAAKKAEGHGMANLNDQVSLWATPKASDGEGGRTTKTEGGGNAHLPIQARESASWPTPTSRDGKDGSFTPNVPLNGLLGRMVWATPRASPNENRTTKITPSQEAGKHGMYLAVQAIGTTQNSGSAPTEKRGALSPEFVFWLMGWSEEWQRCALAATESWSLSRRKSSSRSGRR